MANRTGTATGKTVGTSNQEGAALWRIMATNQRRESPVSWFCYSSQWLFPFALPCCPSCSHCCYCDSFWHKYWACTVIWWYNYGRLLLKMIISAIIKTFWYDSTTWVIFCLWRSGLLVWRSSFSVDKSPIYLSSLQVKYWIIWVDTDVLYLSHGLLICPLLMGENYLGPKQALQWCISLWIWCSVI